MKLYQIITVILPVIIMSCASNYRVSNPSENGDYVIMIHGLGASSAYFRPLEKALKAEGYSTIRVGYPSTRYSIEKLSDQIFPLILKKTADKNKKIHFVTHSLGGLLLRYYLHDNTIENLGIVIMLAPPNRGSEIIDFYKENSIVSSLIGPAAMQMGTEKTDLPHLLGDAYFSPIIIAGTKSYSEYFSSILPGDDDGKISVFNCSINGMKELITLPYTHEQIVRRKETINIIVDKISQ